MNAEFLDALEQLQKEKDIPMAALLQTVEAAMASAYRKHYGSTEEVRLAVEPTWNVGDKITVTEFKPGEFVDVIGTTKGKGFQGVVRRHKFAGGPASHGQKGWFRRPGAIGERLFPGRVFRGQRMPGHMGHVKVTTQNLRVVQVRGADNVLLIEGSVPGARGSYVVVRHAKKKSAKPAMKAA